MYKPDKRLQKLYVKYNKLYFDNSLPSDVQVGWVAYPEDSVHIAETATLDEDNGVIHHTIYIGESIRSLDTVVKMTLLHEMVHVKIHPYNKHGRKFDEEMLRLASRGAFNKLW